MDATIWEFAASNGYVIVTLDADFAELAALRGVIWLRCGNQPMAAVATLLRNQNEAIRAFEQDPAACLEIYTA
jgi:predicted nuclease of predicted toxin-antitoxin system